MLQVDRNQMHKFIYLFFIMFFTSCSSINFNNELAVDSMSENNSKKEESFSKKEYKGISKDAIFEAAKKVFLLADKNQFRIDSYRDHLYVSKTKLSHFFLYPVTHEDRWDLIIEEKDNVSIAKLTLVRITDFDEEKVEYLSKYNHDLFWNRIDYLLGISKEWISCDSITNLRGTLCDSLDMYNKRNPRKDDLVKDILIENRKVSKELNEINDDILNEDIDFTLDEEENDILEKEESFDTQENEDKTLDEALDKEIDELDKKVNSNIDKTLGKIENDRKDEQLIKEDK